MVKELAVAIKTIGFLLVFYESERKINTSFNHKKISFPLVLCHASPQTAKTNRAKAVTQSGQGDGRAGKRQPEFWILQENGK